LLGSLRLLVWQQIGDEKLATLTVGPTQQFSSLAAAVDAASSGDVIQVQAGTYTNDFPSKLTNLTIEGVGGMARFVATDSPDNGKAQFVTEGTVTLQNIEVSGVAVSGANGAGVRYQGGNLTLDNVYFHDNQEGLLAIDDPNGSITIRNSEFADNGSDGYSHNVYINNVGTTVVDNSYIHDVLGNGSEFRSRGANTTITNSRIVDNGNADNYTIDLPAGGNVVLQNNVLEKAAGATNPIMVHYGIDSVVPWHAGSSLTATGNTFINEDGSSGIGIFNGAYQAGADVTIQVSNNTVYGLTAAHFVQGGPANVTGTNFLSGLPQISAAAPWVSSDTSDPAPVATPTATPDPTPAATPTATPDPTSVATPTATPDPASSTSPASSPTAASDDTLVLNMSGDMWNGGPEFTVSVDGVQVGGVNTVTAVASAGQSQAFTFTGDFGSGQHDIAVSFLNDAYGGSYDTDRNLYVNSIDYDGQHYGSVASALYANETVHLTVGSPSQQGT
jgi:Ca-dependent carbohydrate-binding module xylan-binding/Right handed beta helix region